MFNKNYPPRPHFFKIFLNGVKISIQGKMCTKENLGLQKSLIESALKRKFKFLNLNFINSSTFNQILRTYSA